MNYLKKQTILKIKNMKKQTLLKINYMKSKYVFKIHNQSEKKTILKMNYLKNKPKITHFSFAISYIHTECT